MEIDKIASQGLLLKYKLSLSRSDIESAVNVKIATLAKTAKLPGFRPGKAPIALVSRKVLPEIRQEVLEEKLNEGIRKITSEQTAALVGDPSCVALTNENDDPSLPFWDSGVCFEITIEVMPDISLEQVDLSQIRLEFPCVQFNEEEIKELLLRELKTNLFKKEQENFTLVNDRPCEYGDVVTVEIVYKEECNEHDHSNCSHAKDDEKITTETLCLSQNMEDYWANELVGHVAVNEVKEIAIEGVKADVKVLGIYTRNVALGEESLKELGAKDLESAISTLKEATTTRINDKIYFLNTIKLLTEIGKQLPLEIPPSLLKQEISNLKEEIKPLAHAQTEEEMEAICNKIAARRIMSGLYVGRYATQHKIQFSENDVTRAMFFGHNTGNSRLETLINFTSMAKSHEQREYFASHARAMIMEYVTLKRILEQEITKIERNCSAKEALEWIKNTEIEQTSLLSFEE